MRDEIGPESTHLHDAHHDKQKSTTAHDSARMSAGEREDSEGTLGTDSGEEKRDPQPKAVREGEKGAAPSVGRACGESEYGGEGGSDAGRPPDPEQDSEQRCTGDSDARLVGQAQGATGPRDPIEESCEHQAEHDREGTEDAGNGELVFDQARAKCPKDRAVAGEDGREPQDEENGPEHRAAPQGGDEMTVAVEREILAAATECVTSAPTLPATYAR